MSSSPWRWLRRARQVLEVDSVQRILLICSEPFRKLDALAFWLLSHCFRVLVAEEAPHALVLESTVEQVHVCRVGGLAFAVGRLQLLVFGLDAVELLER